MNITQSPFNTPTQTLEVCAYNTANLHPTDRAHFNFLVSSLSNKIGKQTLLSAAAEINRRSYGFTWHVKLNDGLNGRSFTLYQSRTNPTPLLHVSID